MRGTSDFLYLHISLLILSPPLSSFPSGAIVCASSNIHLSLLCCWSTKAAKLLSSLLPAVSRCGIPTCLRMQLCCHSNLANMLTSIWQLMQQLLLVLLSNSVLCGNFFVELIFTLRIFSCQFKNNAHSIIIVLVPLQSPQDLPGTTPVLM